MLSFTQESERFKKSYASQELCKVIEDDKYLEIKEIHNKIPVVAIAELMPEIKEPIELAKKMKSFIDTFHSFKETNPSILFNLRYLPNLKG